MKKIILTGGGTAGHIIPNLALVPALKQAGFQIHYIGSKGGMEEALVKEHDIPFYGISSGKMRRYLSFKNITDIFRIAKGYFDALKILKKINPDLVFSKGGFVVVPVIAAAKTRRIRAVIHESDRSVGLANKLAIPFASTVCCSFEETMAFIPNHKAVYTGSPIRNELFHANKENGYRFTGTDPNRKPILLITGGSTGAQAINATIYDALPELLEYFQIIHLCGKGKMGSAAADGYHAFEYISNEMADVLAISDLVISRAGANTIFELVALKKPNLLIPLGLSASRGDQILNASSFEAKGFSMVLSEDALTKETLVSAVQDLYKNRMVYIQAMHENMPNAVEKIVDILQKSCINPA